MKKKEKKTYSNPSPDQPKEKNKESSNWPMIIIAIIACICFPVAIIAAIIWLIQKFNK